MNKFFDELEMELDRDVSPGIPVFRGTGVPGKPSNLHLFAEPKKMSVAEMLRAEDEAKLLVTEAQILRERARRKEAETMKGMK